MIYAIDNYQLISINSMEESCAILFLNENEHLTTISIFIFVNLFLLNNFIFIFVEFEMLNIITD